jgi:hypothetical protein
MFHSPSNVIQRSPLIFTDNTLKSSQPPYHAFVRTARAEKSHFADIITAQLKKRFAGH